MLSVECQFLYESSCVKLGCLKDLSTRCSPNLHRGEEGEDTGTVEHFIFIVLLEIFDSLLYSTYALCGNVTSQILLQLRSDRSVKSFKNEKYK